MNKIIKSILIGLSVMFSLMCYSSPLDSIHQHRRINMEKEALVKWVFDNSHNKISEGKAKQIINYAYEYSSQYKIDPLLVLSIIKIESGFREKVRSPYGATGLMQVVPRFHKNKLKGRDPSNISVSIEVGSHILREYLDTTDKDLRRALNKYSGGSKVYYRKVAKTHHSIATHLVEYSFSNEMPIYAFHQINKPIINAVDNSYKLAQK